MDTIRNVIITGTFICIIVVGSAYKMWIEEGRRGSFKSELRTTLILLIVFAGIAAVSIYLNN